MAFYQGAVRADPAYVPDGCVPQLLDAALFLYRIDADRYPLSVALSWAEEAVRRCPQSADAHAVLGGFYRATGQTSQARVQLQEALAIDPQLIRAWRDLARCHLDLGERDKANGCHQAAIRIPVSSAADRVDRASVLLTLGHFAEGWREKEAGYQVALDDWGRPPYLRSLSRLPRWNGQPTRDRVLVHGADGYGDVFMMLRFVPLLRSRVGALTLQVPDKLVDFLAQQPWDVQVRGFREDLTGFGCWTDTYALPHLLGSGAIPPAPYLSAPGAFASLEGTCKVGLVWAGNPGHYGDLHRSSRLAEWEPVLEVQGVSFYSLQLGKAAQQLDGYRDRIHDLAPQLTDWTATAGALCELDLVITIDSAVANLAGALGRPVWVCLAAAPDWRWLLDRPDTPWYGSARLSRQPKAADWGGVFADVATALGKLVAGKQEIP